jgi:hypothetical protein
MRRFMLLIAMAVLAAAPAVAARVLDWRPGPIAALYETGEHIVARNEPVRVFEMTLRRVGDSDWSAGGAVTAK